MSIIFNAEEHSYKSIDTDENIKWISVTTLISKFKKPFDAVKVAKKVSKKKNSKWFGMTPAKIQEIWNNESLRAMSLGTFYHNQREADICSLSSMEREGFNIPVFVPQESKDGVKTAPHQKLDPGVYPEHMVYLKSAGICGQADLVEVLDGRVNIIDYKTNKEIKTESFRNWEGKSERLDTPLTHMDDCNFSHYSLQLSIYMYIIIKHNPKLKPGNIHIHHVRFEEESKDEHGYPITKYTAEGDPVIKEVIQMPIDYLKDEVISIVHWLYDNRSKLK